jgi:hypothetical protein
VAVDSANAFVCGLKAPTDFKIQGESDKVDVRLKEGCAAIDAAERLPGFNDAFSGKAPDIGAYEFGAALPHYGPRPKK